MNDNAPIDRFVEILNERGFESLPEQEVPPELRIGVPNDFGWCDCRQQSLGGRAGTELGALPIPALYLYSHLAVITGQQSGCAVEPENSYTFSES